MNFGNIESYILFGGGTLLAKVSIKLRELGLHVLVVTSPRHSKETLQSDLYSGTLQEFLEENSVEYVVSKNVSTDGDMHQHITTASLGLSFGAAWIFREEFIDRFSGRLLNVHAARLPQNRGAGGFSWRIMRGESINSSLIHQVDPGVDTGMILLNEEYIYPAQCRIPADFIQYTIDMDEKTVAKFVGLVSSQHEFSEVSQDESFSSYWPRLATDIHGFIDWSWKLTDIERFICAFDEPYLGASTFLGDRKVRLKDCQNTKIDGSFHPFQVGMVYRITTDMICVATENGTLLIKRVLDENGNDIKEQLSLGERFYSPREYLEAAQKYRAVYTPEGLKGSS